MQFMQDPHNNQLWMQKNDLHKRAQQKVIDQEIYWIQRAQSNWALLGDKSY